MSVEQDLQKLQQRVEDITLKTLENSQEIVAFKANTLLDNQALTYTVANMTKKLLAALCIVFFSGMYILYEKPVVLEQRTKVKAFTNMSTQLPVQDPYVNFARYGDKLVGWTLSLFTPLFGGYILWDRRRRPRR